MPCKQCKGMHLAGSSGPKALLEAGFERPGHTTRRLPPHVTKVIRPRNRDGRAFTT
jgi:hypothetical protein